jgi:zinc/manganese transport system permease protein
LSVLGSLMDWWLRPFVEFAFMRRALAACCALSLSSSPIGVFLTLRRMSLVGDATAHAVLPGVALGFVFAGPSILAMSLGGFVAGLAVAGLAGVAARFTVLREDASFAALYLIALAFGVLLVSVHGTQVDLVHMLFGSVLAIDRQGCLLVAAASTITLIFLAIGYRALVVESVDPLFLTAHGHGGALFHTLFITLVVINLVAGFQSLGTLMAVGLMMLPAAAARSWAIDLPVLLAAAGAIGVLAAFLGLALSFRWDLPSGPAIVLTAGAIYVASSLFAPYGFLPTRLRQARLPQT